MLPQSPPSVALVNGTIILPESTVVGKALYLLDGRVHAICAVDDVPSDVPRIDVQERLITPGLVDIHIHGAEGANFNDGTATSFAMALHANASAGVTSLLATTATAPLPQLVATLETAQTWMEKPGIGANLLGVHVEG
jgi:N-acetylglucosamine-6-phosphate deacetylase